MSTGHPHAGDNMRSPAEVERLMKQPGAIELMKRWERLDVEHDVPDLTGYNVAGTVRYLDKDAFKALTDPAYAQQIGVHSADSIGISPEQVVQCLVQHEDVEKVLLDSDSPIDTYAHAHDCATVAEHAMVRKFGGTPLKYERALKAMVAFCETKELEAVDPDFACAPYIEAPDANDRKAIKAMQELGVEDASKVSRKSVNYSRATKGDRCEKCRHWQSDDSQLSRCEIVEGLVRHDRWCERWEAAQGTRPGEEASVEAPLAQEQSELDTGARAPSAAGQPRESAPQNAAINAPAVRAVPGKDEGEASSVS